MVEPLALQTASMRARRSLAWRSAMRLSIVSPDWLMTITRVDRSRTGSR